MYRDSIQGKVVSIQFSPGREDGLLLIQLDGEQQTQQLSLYDSYSKIWIDGTMYIDDGKMVDSAYSVIEHLLLNKCSVTLYPDRMRYGLSVKAEFVLEPV